VRKDPVGKHIQKPKNTIKSMAPKTQAFKYNDNQEIEKKIGTLNDDNKVKKVIIEQVCGFFFLLNFFCHDKSSIIFSYIFLFIQFHAIA
jgi:hypothetical protein